MSTKPGQSHNSIRKTITAKLSLWFNPRIDAATAESDFDLRELRNSLHAIYVGVTPDNIARLRPLLALFFQQLVDLTVRTLPQFDPKAKHQVLVLLDEFPLLGPMPILADAFAFVAGYNMRLMLIMQSKAQLRDKDLYGPDKASAMLDNCGIEVIFGTKDLQLTKELSERMGFDTVESYSQSGPRFWRAFRGKNVNVSESDKGRALLLPQEVGRLKSGDAIIVRPGMYPIRVKRIRYFKERLFNRLLRKAPIVEPIEVVVRMDQGTGFHPPSAAAGASPAATRIEEASATPTAPAPVEKAAGKGKAKAKKPAGETSEDSSSGPTSGPIVHPVQSQAAPAAPAPSTAGIPVLRPFQANGLIAGLMGADVDLSQYAMKDGKAKLAAILDGVSTVESLNRGRGIAAE